MCSTIYVVSDKVTYRAGQLKKYVNGRNCCAAAGVLKRLYILINHPWQTYCNRGWWGLCFTYTDTYINHHSSQKAFSCVPTFAIQCTDTLTINSNNFVWLLYKMKFLHYILFFLVVFAPKMYEARPKGKVRKEPFFFLRCLFSMLQEPRCNLPMKDGLCRATFPRWYFNRQTGVCEHFLYGGCGGNKNNFRTKDECIRACAPW